MFGKALEANMLSLRRKGGPNIRILMYHRIIPDGLARGPKEMDLLLSRFRRHLCLFRDWGFVSITFEDVRRWFDEGVRLPDRPVILSFDDGHADTYEFAFPLLKELGMRAVVFALGDREMRRNEWDIQLGLSVSPLVTDEQLLEMRAAGFEIGSHSMTHAHLTELSHAEAWKEISQSKTKLECLLNAPVATFAYPYGELNPEVKHLVREAGYRFACGAWSGPPRVQSDPLEIRRAVISGKDGAVRLGFKVIFPYKHYRWLWWRVKSAIVSARAPIGDCTPLNSAPADANYRRSDGG
jgi:peptidoglycan/xylan/chitin deacetylase (PgdA/CDA1 family)